MTLERLQFIGVLVWMIGMLVLVVWAMRDLIKSENAEHEQRQAQNNLPESPKAESKSGTTSP